MNMLSKSIYLSIYIFFEEWNALKIILKDLLIIIKNKSKY